MNIDKEFELLKEYMSVYIQLLPYSWKCKSSKLTISWLPSFEYFKNFYNDQAYSLSIPHFKESIEIPSHMTPMDILNIYRQTGDILFRKVHTHGLGSEDGNAYRYYNFWEGCKYFTNNNLEGNYSVS